MERTLVLETKSFALGLYHLLRELDPARWQHTRKQALKDRVLALESQVHQLYADLQELSPAGGGTQELKRSVALSATLRKVGDLLGEMKQVQNEPQLSYLALYSLRKRLQKVYQRLSLVMEAYETPIPHLRPTNLARSLFHCASAVGILLTIVSVPSFGYMFWIALPYLLFCWGTEGLKRLSPEAKAKVMWFFAPIAHPHEYDKINSATWYGVALFLLSLLPSPLLGLIAITVLGFADPAAALVGRKYGTIRLPGNRSLEGSLGFVVAGTVATTVMLNLLHPIGGFWTTLAVAASASVCGALGELAGKWPDDNLTIPVASAAGASAMLMLLGMPWA